MDILTTIIQNSEKIGIGAVCFGLLIITLYGLRWMSQYINKDQAKDQQMFDLHLKSIEAVGSIKDVGKIMVETQQSSKASYDSLSTFLQTLDASLKKWTGDILSKLDNNQIAILNAINTWDLAALRKGVIVVNPSGRIVSVNSDALAILDMKSDDVLNTTLKDRSTWFVFADGSPVPPNEIPTVFALTTAMPSRHNVLGLIKPPSTTVKWLLVDADPVLSTEERRVTRVVITIRDVGDFVLSKSDTMELNAVNVGS